MSPAGGNSLNPRWTTTSLHSEMQMQLDALEEPYSRVIIHGASPSPLDSSISVRHPQQRFVARERSTIVLPRYWMRLSSTGLTSWINCERKGTYYVHSLSRGEMLNSHLPLNRMRAFPAQIMSLLRVCSYLSYESRIIYSDNIPRRILLSNCILNIR